MTSQLSLRAVAVAASVARDQGLAVDEPLLLHDRSNVLVHLRPAPVVARVSTNTGRLRPGEAWLAREVAIAGHLARAGAPVVAPSAALDPGPHEHDGLVLSFWELARSSGAEVDAQAAGRALRECHEALADFRDELPELGALDEAERLLGLVNPAADDADLLRERLARARRAIEAMALPNGPLHGDSHLRNVIQTSGGPRWLDWEDTFAGPVEWDLACLLAHPRAFGEDEAPARAALDAYGWDAGDARLDPFVEARAIQLALWALFVVDGHPEVRPRLDAALRWIRARSS